MLVHGDVNEGQILVDEGLRVTGVLDWETAHLGHPLKDFDLGEWGYGIFAWDAHFHLLRRRMWEAYAESPGGPPPLLGGGAPRLLPQLGAVVRPPRGGRPLGPGPPGEPPSTTCGASPNPGPRRASRAGGGVAGPASRLAGRGPEGVSEKGRRTAGSPRTT